ncbi:hypothetical protein ACEXQE_06760 [Herbiconiux sp. P17]|uniref:hypothetical protein n=1 Tax=Herbiconiux wuyangfengii TaxID=3342794 RepID=UPI0035BB7D54
MTLVIENATEYAKWFDSAPSPERWAALSKEHADLATWVAILDEYPRCQIAVARNATVPLEILERLRYARDFDVQWTVRSHERWREAHPDDPDPFDFDLDELIYYDLSSIERKVLRHGLVEWGGPAHCTEELAVAMGFASIADLFAESKRITGALKESQPMRHIDWARTMLATEIVFMSGTVGAAGDWEIMTGIPDLETFKTIRGLQSHLIVNPVIGKAFGTRFKRPH